MENLPRRRLIGVLGGMGPSATIDFMSKIVAMTPAGADQEHVPLIVHDVPQIPDRSLAIQARSDAPFLPMLAGLRMLELNGVDAVAIPCNTAHFWYDRLSRSGRVEIIHIATAVASLIQQRGAPPDRMALMATRGTIEAGIYQGRLAGLVDELIVPSEPIQKLIDLAVAATKRNDLDRARIHASQAARELLDEGAGALLLACTELPVALSQSPYLDMSVDATEALARACVAASFADERSGPVA
jgi:aspartate racemase